MPCEQRRAYRRLFLSPPFSGWCLLWHASQSAARLSGSKASSGNSSTDFLWCAVVAGVVLPYRLHSWHKPCARCKHISLARLYRLSLYICFLVICSGLFDSMEAPRKFPSVWLFQGIRKPRFVIETGFIYTFTSSYYHTRKTLSMGPPFFINLCCCIFLPIVLL